MPLEANNRSKGHTELPMTTAFPGKPRSAKKKGSLGSHRGTED